MSHHLADSTAGGVTSSSCSVTLYLVRHGETDWNRQGRWQGQADVPLNRRGWRQARLAAQRLKDAPLAAIISSDLQRAACTAELIARSCRRSRHCGERGSAGVQPPVILDPRLREIHQGAWQGLQVSEIQQRYARLFQKRMQNPLAVAPPGGETALQVRQRVVAAVDDIRHRFLGGAVAIVSHGFALAMILVHYQQQPLERIWELVPENGAVIELRLDGLPCLASD